MDSGEDALNFGRDLMRFEPEPVARLRKLGRRPLIAGLSPGCCATCSAIPVVSVSGTVASNQRWLRNFLFRELVSAFQLCESIEL